MRYATNEIPICSECPDDELKICDRCHIQYCKHYASNTDIRHCGNCLADFRVVESIVTKIVEHMDENDEVISRRRSTCKSLSLSGTDWLFAAHKINTLTDEELTATIEYHRELASQMLQEREERRIARYARLSNVKINITPRAINGNEAVTKAAKVKSPSTGKRVRTAKQPDADAIAAAFTTLFGSKISPEQIATAMAALGKKE
jgi:hypothetical protein